MAEQKRPRSLQEIIDSVPNIVDYLYSNRKGSVVRDAVLRQPPPHVQPEYTNWREEQRAWRETVALYDQSYHMTTSILRGPDALRLISYLAVNSFQTFGPLRARHFMAVSPRGHVIGDGILYCLEPNELYLVGRAAGHNWVQFHAKTGNWDVTYERDEIFTQNPAGRRTFYRFEVEGPNAFALLEYLTGEPLPATRLFHIVPLRIAGHQVWALRHTMAGGPGYELFGPWDEGPEVKAAIIEAGQRFGLRQVGSLAYFTTALEIGWIGRPLPGIYTGEELRPFREWLPATANEASWSLGGSFYSPNVEDYYFTPWELGYGHLVKFDHDFIGRSALEAMASRRHRVKVTLVWDADDLAALVKGYWDSTDLPPKYIDWPLSTYANWQYDTVLDDSGRVIGVSTYVGMIWHERAMLSLAVLEPEYATPGTRVRVVWGEPDGGARSRPWLEPHRQVEVRATVAPVPLSEYARQHLAAARSGRR